jgi:hypothetical protein
MIFERRCFTGFLGLLLVWATGCRTQPASNAGARAADGFFSAIMTPLADAISQHRDVAYAAEAFQRRNGRWPCTYAELSEFVDGSQGYLHMKEYDEMLFTPEPDGALAIVMLMQGRTNTVRCRPQERREGP